MAVKKAKAKAKGKSRKYRRLREDQVNALLANPAGVAKVLNASLRLDNKGRIITLPRMGCPYQGHGCPRKIDFEKTFGLPNPTG